MILVHTNNIGSRVLQFLENNNTNTLQSREWDQKTSIIKL